MHIVSSASDFYTPHFATFLHSAWHHNKNANFYMLSGDITAKNEQALNDFSKEKGIKLEIIKYDINSLKFLSYESDTIANKWAIDIWARILIPKLLPKTCKKAIYIDSDAVVIGSLEEYYNFEMSGNPLGACPIPIKNKVKEKLGFHENETYYNAGSLLIDIEQWRKLNISDKIYKFAVNNSEKLQYADQDAINYVLKNKIHTLPSQFNFFPTKLEYNDLNTAPKVIHYAGETKPWDHTYMPCAKLYFYHRNKTPWQLKIDIFDIWHLKNQLKYIWKLIFLNKSALRTKSAKAKCNDLFLNDYFKL